MDDTETPINLAYAVHDGVRQEQLLTKYVQHHVGGDSSANGPEADRATKKSPPETFQYETTKWFMPVSNIISHTLVQSFVRAPPEPSIQDNAALLLLPHLILWLPHLYNPQPKCRAIFRLEATVIRM